MNHSIANFQHHLSFDDVYYELLHYRTETKVLNGFQDLVKTVSEVFSFRKNLVCTFEPNRRYLRRFHEFNPMQAS